MAILYSAAYGSAKVYRVDTAAKTIENAFVADCDIRGIACDLDGYVHCYDGDTVVKVHDPSDGSLIKTVTHADLNHSGTNGYAVDHEGYLWPGGYSGSQSKNDPVTGAKILSWNNGLSDTDPRAWTLDNYLAIAVHYDIYKCVPATGAYSLYVSTSIYMHDGGFDFDARDETIWCCRQNAKTYYQVSVATGQTIQSVTPTPIGGLGSNPTVDILAHRDRFYTPPEESGWVCLT